MAHNGPRDWANIKQDNVAPNGTHSNKPQPIKIRVIGRNLNRNHSINDEEENAGQVDDPSPSDVETFWCIVIHRIRHSFLLFLRHLVVVLLCRILLFRRRGDG